MDPIGQGMAVCPYCGGRDLRSLYSGAFHPFLKDHGPWDMHRCSGCGSLVTHPLPRPDQLTRLYGSFEGGMIPAVRHIRDAYPLEAWFRQCMDHALHFAGRSEDRRQVFNWADLGAGAGEMAAMLAGEFPASKGVAVDISDRPPLLEGVENVDWVRDDLSGGVKTGMSHPVDLALSITVVEHLAAPDAALRKWIGEISEGGCLYLTTPRADCTAFRLMGRRWPYLIPGEHLHIPTRKGMRLLLDRICEERFGKGNYEVQVRSVVLPYPIGYFLGYIGIDGSKLGKLGRTPVRIPTGLLEAAVRRK